MTQEPKNVVVQGDLVSIVDGGSHVVFTVKVSRGTAIADPQIPGTYLDYNKTMHDLNRRISSIHLGTVSLGQGITAYHELSTGE